MEEIGPIILLIYLLGGILVIGILIYLVAKRINDKGKEDFEQRDN